MKKLLIILLLTISLALALTACDAEEIYSQLDIDSMVGELEEALNEKNAANEAAITALRSEYELKVALLESSSATATERLDSLTEEYEAKVAELASAGKANSDALAALKTEYDAKIAELTESGAANSDAITALSAEYAAKVEALEAEDKANSDALAALEAEYAESYAELTEEIGLFNESIANAKTDLQDTIDALGAQHASEVEEINALIGELREADTANGARIKALEDEVSAIKSSVQKSIEDLEEGLDALTERIDALEAELEKLGEVKTHTVLFDPANGGASFTATVEHGMKVTTPTAPEKDGYTFDGWYVGDEKWVFSGYPVTESVTLTARWNAIPYRINYETNGGVNSADNPTSYTKDSDLSLLAPMRYGYTFLGWYDNARLDGEAITKIAPGNSGEKTFYAAWAITRYTLTVDTDGGVIDGYLPESFTVFDEDLYVFEPVKEGYDFTGWLVNGTETVDYYVLDASCAENVSLKALYTLKSYTVTYYLNGLKNSPENPSTFYHFNEMIILADAEAVGDKSFYGWYSDPEFNHRCYAIPANFARNVTLYAKTDIYWWDDINYEATTLRMQMTDCSNAEELPSGCARYLAGERPENRDVDKYVADRNDNALYYTNIKSVNYEYYPDDAKFYGFSATIDIMYETVMNPDSRTPDIFCNWMTDLLCASLKGTFANIYSRMRGEDDQYGKNYFDTKDEGYMNELMGSLTLSQDKVYVIASDYFIDIIRSFFVVPVNVQLYNSIAPDMTEDFNEDGVCDFNDFYEEVYNGDWTYQRLIEYSAKIYVDSNKTIDGEDCDDVLGFALAKNGLPAAGLVYSSSVILIHKTPNIYGGFDFAYPDENQYLYDLFAAIDNLVDATGIVVVDDRGNDISVNTRVRTMFSTDKLLFGGIIIVGALEYESYQEMKSVDSGGFGIVPVPVYKEGDSYLTQIHSVGRAGAIAHSTTKFAQCTAFLHYQSSNSREVLDEYYDYQLTYDIWDNLDGNVEMLRYIRNNVRTSFDKLYEDAIGFFYEGYTNPGSSNNRWHTMLVNYGYTMTATDIRNRYTELVGSKQESLKTLIAQYDTLPN